MVLFIKIQEQSGVPKYQQICNSVVLAVENGELANGQVIPSINELAEHFSLARGTVMRAYSELQKKGIIAPQQGKGFYVVNPEPKPKKVFVLFDTLNAYKEVLYGSLQQTLGDYATLHIFFHHHNREVFENLIIDSLGSYSFYVIMPHFNEDVTDILGLIPTGKLLIIDKEVEGLGSGYAAVYQDFENDIYRALESGLDLLRKYERLHLVLSKHSFQFVPDGIVRGFRRFGQAAGFLIQVDEELTEEAILPKEAYIVFTDNDLIRFVKLAQRNKWILGKDIGLISYDDTPMKEVLSGGITVISTDFTRMGQVAARMIRGELRTTIANESALIRRCSL